MQMTRRNSRTGVIFYLMSTLESYLGPGGHSYGKCYPFVSIILLTLDADRVLNASYSLRIGKIRPQLDEALH